MPKTSSLYVFGFLNGLLPCAWLFLILITLTKIQNLFLFYIFILIFWIGTVPVFSVLHWRNRFTSKLAFFTKNKRLMFLLYLMLALYVFTLHFKTPPPPDHAVNINSLLCIGPEN